MELSKDCRDGTETNRIEMGEGSSFGEGQDPVEERHLCGPMPHSGPKGLKKEKLY